MPYIGKQITQNIISDSSDITDGSVATADLADNAVTSAKIGDDAVGTDQLANDVVVNTSGAITTTADTSLKGNVTINEDSADKDFRVESNGNANMLVVDGGTDTVCVGTNQTGFEASYDDLIVGSGTGHNGITVYSGNDSVGAVAFADATSGNATYDGYIQYEHNATQFTIGVNSGTTAKALNITSAGNIKFPAGQGIDFSASTDTGGAGDWATVSNEVLSDYEYGTFNPRFYDITGSLSYGYQQGRYVRVGHLCHFQFYIYVTGQNGNNNAYTIERLPFTVSSDNTSNSYSSCSMWAGFGFNNSDATSGYSALTIGNTDRLTVYGHRTAPNASNHSYTQIIYSNCASATGFYCSGTYYIA